MQAELWKLFVIVDISGAELRVWDQNGDCKCFYDLESVSLWFSVLPMGLSWAFLFAAVVMVLAAVMTEYFFDGENVSEGEKLMAAILLYRPDIRKEGPIAMPHTI